MRRPAELKAWYDEDQLLVWLRDSKTVDEYSKRMAIWLAHFRTWHAGQIAEMIGVSIQAVWLWIGQYNRSGPSGINRQGRGGRRWSFLSREQEKRLLDSLRAHASKGTIITAKQVHSTVCEAVGKKVSLDYVYRMLHRNEWRKIGPRPRHVKADTEAQETFKKTSRRK